MRTRHALMLVACPIPSGHPGSKAILISPSEERSASGDSATVPALRKLLEKPDNIELLGGNLAKCAQRSFVDAICGKDISVREAINAKLAAMRNELLGDSPTPIEVLLVERIVACWLQVQDAEIRTAQAKDMTFKQADFHQRRMDSTSKAFGR